MRGETGFDIPLVGGQIHFNPLPSCEGRPDTLDTVAHMALFQSTPLMRGETRRRRPGGTRAQISIHSPHARGDETDGAPERGAQKRISIHSPHARGDGVYWVWSMRTARFQSTPLMRGETLTRAEKGAHLENFNPLPSCEGRRPPTRMR